MTDPTFRISGAAAVAPAVASAGRASRRAADMLQSADALGRWWVALGAEAAQQPALLLSIPLLSPEAQDGLEAVLWQALAPEEEPDMTARLRGLLSAMQDMHDHPAEDVIRQLLDWYDEAGSNLTALLKA